MLQNDRTHTNKDDFHLNHLASVGQIAAGIAHEVKNPLTAVKGFLHLLKEQHNEQYITIAESELDNALSTLENLLNVAKPSAEDELYESFHTCVDLEALIYLFQDQIYRVQVITDFRDTDALVYGKRNQIKKALFNLVKNAFEAIDDEGFITVKHYLQNEYIVISIEDTGTGIPEDKLKLLGTPFYTTKAQGTGMGLTQVFTVIYEHQGKTEVYSKEGQGTVFIVKLPKRDVKQSIGAIKLSVNYEQGQDFREFLLNNRDQFEKRLFIEAVNVNEAKIEEIFNKGNIDLISNAHKLLLYIVEGREQEIASFARQEGIAWAENSLALSYKLDWIQAVRRVIRDFLYNFDLLSKANHDREDFYRTETQIIALIDQFLSCFIISYSEYKNMLIESLREILEDLSISIIPFTSNMCILLLIGYLDVNQAAKIEEKLITYVGAANIETIFIDLSSVTGMDPPDLQYLLNILNGLSIMGCKTVVTGIRPNIVKMMIHSNISFEDRAIMKGTLQQALVEILK